MTRDEALDRYRRLAEIRERINAGLVDRVPPVVLLEHARRIGVAHGRLFTAEGVLEMALALDLAFHTAKEGRSRPLDRYAKAANPAPGSDEALVLNAMRRARFSVWRILRRHEAAGFVVEDALRKGETWLMDEAVELTAPEEGSFAGRL